MLGLGSSVNSQEGYAKGERYRERFLDTDNTYHPVANPYGHDGKESDWIGNFTAAGSVSKFLATNSVISSESGTIKILSTAINGHGSVAVKTVPNVNYTLTVQWDPNDTAQGGGDVMVGTGAGSSSLGSATGGVTADITLTVNFNSGSNSSVYISLVSARNDKYVFFDDLSLKEA